MTKASPENVFSQLRKLANDTRITRNAHFLAKERKRRTFRLLGMVGILLNVLVATGFFDAVIPGETAAAFIKGASVIAGAFAAIQTLLNFQKETELHGQAGESYTEIYRRTTLLIAEYEDGLKDAVQMTDVFRKLMEKHFEVNERFANCVPDNKDFRKARQEIGLARNWEPQKQIKDKMPTDQA